MFFMSNEFDDKISTARREDDAELDRKLFWSRFQESSNAQVRELQARAERVNAVTQQLFGAA